MNRSRTALRIASTIFATHLSLSTEMSHGWSLTGSNPHNYDTSIAAGPANDNAASAVSLRSIGRPRQGFGTLMQRFKADGFRGKRVRLSSYVRSDSVNGWAGLWMRVDGPRKEPLAFDNMQNRPINGTTHWTNYDVVLDVPVSAKEISVGLLLAGTGQVWLEEMNLQTVEKCVPATGATRGVPGRSRKTV